MHSDGRRSIMQKNGIRPTTDCFRNLNSLGKNSCAYLDTSSVRLIRSSHVSCLEWH